MSKLCQVTLEDCLEVQGVLQKTGKLLELELRGRHRVSLACHLGQGIAEGDNAGLCIFPWEKVSM
jgi:hypothetical protein